MPSTTGFDFSFDDCTSSFHHEYGNLDPKSMRSQRTPVGEPQAQSFWEDDYFNVPGVKIEMPRRQSSSSSSSSSSNCFNFAKGLTTPPILSRRLPSRPMMLGRDDSFNLKTSDFDFTADELPEHLDLALNFGDTEKAMLASEEKRGSPPIVTKIEPGLGRYDISEPDEADFKFNCFSEDFSGMGMDNEFGADLKPMMPMRPMMHAPVPAFVALPLLEPPLPRMPLQTLTAPALNVFQAPYVHQLKPETPPEKPKARRGRAPRCASEVVIDVITEVNVSLRALTDRPADLHNREFEDRVSIGKYNRRERREKIERFKQKRRKALSLDRKVLYKCRKRFADARPRVGGRFVKIAE